MLRRDGAWLAAIGRIVPTEGHRRQHVPRAGAGLRAIADDFGPGIWSHLNAINWTRRPIMFTLKNLKDLTDIGSNFNGPPDLEFRHATAALGLEQSGLSYQRVPPGYRFPVGHTHKTQEEVYAVVRGSGRMKLDDQVIEIKEWDVVRVSPGTWRGYEAGADGLEILVFGAPSLGEHVRDDVEGQRDWWAA
jgi:mannose-6-phosphate isomerase-like protein (cupin superfamily)